MQKLALTINGVTYEIPWEEVDVGDSFFIPCVDTSAVIARMRHRVQKFNWEMTYDIRIEAGKWGVRFWRTV
jgi:hypothetical protein